MRVPCTQAAYVDAPIRVAELGFNISAPHMHAIALEALKLEPGDRCAWLHACMGRCRAMSDWSPVWMVVPEPP